jgi:hypothetical protein
MRSFLTDFSRPLRLFEHGGFRHLACDENLALEGIIAVNGIGALATFIVLCVLNRRQVRSRGIDRTK